VDEKDQAAERDFDSGDRDPLFEDAARCSPLQKQ